MLLRYEWFQNESTVTIAIYSKWKEMRHENIIIDKDVRTILITALVNQFTYLIHLGNYFYYNCIMKLSLTNCDSIVMLYFKMQITRVKLKVTQIIPAGL